MSVMENENFEVVEATFYRNTLELSLKDDVKAGIPTNDAKALEEYLNSKMMDKEGVLGVHFGKRSDGTDQTYMDYFKEVDGENNVEKEAELVTDAVLVDEIVRDEA